MRKHKKQDTVIHQKRHRTLLDIVIPNYGRFDLLKKCLNAIPDAIGDSIPYKIYISDNKSSDEDADKFYQELDKDIVVIRNKEDLGFSKSSNIGVRRGFSPLILILTNDVILDADSINSAIKAIDDPTMGVIGFKLRFPMDAEGLPQNKVIRPPGKLQHVGHAINIHSDIIHIFIGWKEDHPKVLKVNEVVSVTGAVFLTRRSIWNKIGGLFEGYGLGTYEDVDFCLSVRELGYNIIVNQTSRGTHYVGATNTPFPMGINKLIFLQRWGSRLAYTEWVHL